MSICYAIRKAMKNWTYISVVLSSLAKLLKGLKAWIFFESHLLLLQFTVHYLYAIVWLKCRYKLTVMCAAVDDLWRSFDKLSKNSIATSTLSDYLLNIVCGRLWIEALWIMDHYNYYCIETMSSHTHAPHKIWWIFAEHTYVITLMVHIFSISDDISEMWCSCFCNTNNNVDVDRIVLWYCW